MSIEFDSSATSASWYEASARQRIDGLVDASTFVEFRICLCSICHVSLTME
jgi:malonate decarboxylase beta subunit